MNPEVVTRRGRRNREPALKLANPPVVEAWVEFRFAPSEDMPLWDEVLAKLFFQQAFDDRYRVEGFLGRTELVLESTGGRPSVKAANVLLDRVRAIKSDTEDRYLQVGRGLLVCNQVRKQESWPEFETLREEALEACSKYCGFFKPVGLRAVAINYRDVLTIPWDQSGKVDLKDYVNLHLEVPPEGFGDVADFRMTCSLDGASSNGVLTLSIRRERQPEVPTGTGAGLRVSMDWNITSSSVSSVEPDVLRQWLVEAHDDLIRLFKNAFTGRGWSLFQPVEDGS